MKKNPELEPDPAALLDERRRLAEVIEGANLGTWEWNVQTGETTFNERWAAILGHTLAELAPVSIQTWRSLTHPEDLAASDALLEKHLRGETPVFECEARMQHKNGSWVWVLDRGMVIERDADGKPLRMAGVRMDIHARKQAEVELVKQRQLADAVVAATPGMLFFKDRNSVIHFANPAYCQHVGKTLSELVGQTDAMLFPAEEAAAHLESDCKVFETGMTVTMDEPQVHRGGVHWHHVVKTPVRDAAGAIIGLVGSVIDITSHKKSEQAISDAALRYKNLFEHSGVGTVIMDANGVFQAINEVAASRMGRKVREIVGKSMRDFFPPEIVKEYLRENRRIISTGVGRSYETSFDMPGGKIHFHVCDEPVKDSRGAVVAVQSCSIDITEGYKLREEAKASQERLQLLIDNLPDPTWFKDTEGRFMAINAPWTSFFNVTREQVIGHTPSEFLPEDIVLSWQATDERLKISRQPERREECHVLPELGERWYEVWRSALFDESGAFKGTLGIARDISDRKRAELGLIVSEEKFNKAFHASPDGFLLSSIPEGRISEVNDTIIRLSGYSREELLGRTTVELDLWVEPGLRDKYIAKIQEHGRVKDFETVFRGKDGVLYNCLISTEMIKLSTGPHFLSVLRDITDRKRAEAEIIKQRDELLRYNEALVGRELRNIELKEEINALCREFGQPARYSPATGGQDGRELGAGLE